MNPTRILVVDDELLIRDLLYDFFAEKNFAVMTANNVTEAMELLALHREFDVILTDIKMDGEDGLSFIDRIRAEAPKLPVIVMTGYPSVETAVEALRKRVFDYIIKPFNINRLFATVKAAADEYRRDREPTARMKDYAETNFDR